MTLISTHDFIYNANTNNNVLRFPDLANGFYTFNIVCNENAYIIQIGFNIFTELVDISILDDSGNYIMYNIPFVANKNISYLIGNIDFNNYKLIYNYNQNRFEFYQI